MLRLQLTIGLSNADFKVKWGSHYTRSLLCAHRLQQCHNYKVSDSIDSDTRTALKIFFLQDPSVQFYGGPLFKYLDFHITTSDFPTTLAYLVNAGPSLMLQILLSAPCPPLKAECCPRALKLCTAQAQVLRRPILPHPLLCPRLPWTCRVLWIVTVDALLRRSR
jgi:hypothetical protein